MLDWLDSSTAWSLSILALVTFAGSLIAIPWILLRLPPHYFDDRHPRTWLEDHHPVLRALALGLKNLFGVVFVLAGIAMLVLPGQGLLTMLIGLSLVDFPGKRAFERKIISIPMISVTINRLREQFGRPPLIVYPHCDLAEAPGVGDRPAPPEEKAQ